MGFLTFIGALTAALGLLIIVKPAVWRVASDIWLHWQGLQRIRPEGDLMCRMAGLAFLCIGAAIIYGTLTATPPAQLFRIHDL